MCITPRRSMRLFGLSLYQVYRYTEVICELVNLYITTLAIPNESNQTMNVNPGRIPHKKHKIRVLTRDSQRPALRAPGLDYSHMQKL